MKYDKSEIMKRAQELRKYEDMTMSGAMKMAWRSAKQKIAAPANVAMVQFVGSEKQIAWARKIVLDFVTNEFWRGNAFAEVLRDCLPNIDTSAKSWIDWHTDNSSWQWDARFETIDQNVNPAAYGRLADAMREDNLNRVANGEVDRMKGREIPVREMSDKQIKWKIYRQIIGSGWIMVSESREKIYCGPVR